MGCGTDLEKIELRPQRLQKLRNSEGNGNTDKLPGKRKHGDNTEIGDFLLAVLSFGPVDYVFYE